MRSADTNITTAVAASHRKLEAFPTLCLNAMRLDNNGLAHNGGANASADVASIVAASIEPHLLDTYLAYQFSKCDSEKDFSALMQLLLQARSSDELSNHEQASSAQASNGQTSNEQSGNKQSGCGLYIFDPSKNRYFCRQTFGAAISLVESSFDPETSLSIYANTENKSHYAFDDSPHLFKSVAPLLEKSVAPHTAIIVPSKSSSETCECFLLFIFEGEINTTTMGSSTNDTAQNLLLLLQLAAATVYKLLYNSSLTYYRQLVGEVVRRSEEFFCTWDQHKGLTIHNNTLWTKNIAPSDNVDIESVFGLPEYFEERVWMKLNKQLAVSLANGKRYDTEYQLTDFRGETRYLKTSITPLAKNQSGAVNFFAAVTRDITEEHHQSLQSEREANTERWLLQRISYLFNNHTQKAVAETMTQLGELLQADRCYTRALTGAMAEKSVYAEWHNSGIRPISAYPFNLEPIKNWVDASDKLISGQGVFINDIHFASGASKKFLDYQKAIDAQATMIVPAMYKNTIIALIVVQSKNPRNWSETEKRSCGILANAIGTVIFQDNVLEELQQNEKRLETAMSAALHGVWELNFRTGELLIHATYLAMLGYPAVSQVTSIDSESQVVHSDDLAEIHAYLERMRRGEISECSHAARHLHQNGSFVWVMTKAKVVKLDEHGKPLLVMGTNIDITPHKNLLTELQLARQEADAANLAKSEFLARMSHEIRTPMNAIIGLNYLLLHSTLSEQQYRYAKDIEYAASSLLSTINNILDFSKIEAGKMALDNHEFSLADLIKSLSVRFREKCASKDIEFLIETRDVPEFLIADATRLTQVLENLVDNAIKFTKQGQVRVALKFSSPLELAAQNGQQQLLVAVTDTGIGMNAEQINSLFDAFSQADNSTTRQHGGAGLGLTICKHFIAMMGGEIRVESKPDAGTAISFHIACTTPQLSDTAKAFALNAPGQQSLQHLRVLLVEDNIVNQQVAAGILKKKSVQVTIASNGREAVDLCRASSTAPFDIILMDIEMPEMNGFEAAAEIYKLDQYQNTPIAAMTAHQVEDQRQSLLNAGFDFVVPKPFEPQLLYQYLSNLTRKEF